MKRQNTFVLLFVLWSVFLIPSVAAQYSNDDSIRVMSFNIRYDEPRDGVNAWSNRKTKVADVIRFHKADVVGVQEALLTQLNDLKSLLPDMEWVGVGRTDGKEAGEYSAIIYRRSRLDRLATGTFWLSETPDKPGSMGWDAAYPRIVTWAKFRDRQSKRTFFMFNTHFDHRGDKARTESSSLILKKIEEIAGSELFILTGDMNVREDSQAYKTMVAGTAKVKLADARYTSKAGHFGGDSTFSAFKELQPGNKIEYIFVHPDVTVLEHGVLSDSWNGLWASDHLPVIAEITIPKNKRRPLK
jgi:endonuclease/exonuclease/phosphatase family metal-dependent hydrolase